MPKILKGPFVTSDGFKPSKAFDLYFMLKNNIFILRQNKF
jgi:hypothetical protein